MTNDPQKLNIPLQFRFLGSDCILNDGSTANNLQLKIINSPPSSNTRPILPLTENSKITISFKKGTSAEALVEENDQLTNLKVETTTSNWTKAAGQNSTTWVFTATTARQIGPEGEVINLSITELKTTSASGLGYLYIDYENIGSYPDGRLVVAIEKTPLLYSGNKVGIGTNKPKTKLEIKQTGVSGEITDFICLNNDGVDSPESRIIWRNGSSGYAAITSRAELDTQQRILRPLPERIPGMGIPGMGIPGMGIPGMGIPGMGIPEPLEPVQPDPEETSNENLVLGGELRFQTANNGSLSDRMIIKHDGKVGIGTTNPKKELHVVGDLALGKDENNKKFIFHTRKDNNGDYLQITSDKSDGTLESNQGITLKRDGNVGIGTTNPSAKLHVDGLVKLGEGSPKFSVIACGVVKLVTESGNRKGRIIAGGGVRNFIFAINGHSVVYLDRSINPDNTVVLVTSYTTNYIYYITEVNNDSFSVQGKLLTDAQNPRVGSFHFMVIEFVPDFVK